MYLAKLKSENQLYAIKSMRKDKILETDVLDNIATEKDIMLDVDHPFVIGMDYLFQDKLRLYFVMPFVDGGDLYQCIDKRFPEETVKFYAAQVVHAIGYLHKKGYAHRDIKLENVLID